VIRLTAAVLGVFVLAGQSFPNVTGLGQATVRYRDDSLQVILNYDYSQKNHNSPWILIDFAARSERQFVLDREHIMLVPEVGPPVPVASERRFVQSGKIIQALRQNASIYRRDLGVYLGPAVTEKIRFFALPGDGIVITGTLLQKDRNTIGELYFEAPTGEWTAGHYALQLDHPLAHVALPITLL